MNFVRYYRTPTFFSFVAPPHLNNTDDNDNDNDNDYNNH